MGSPGPQMCCGTSENKPAPWAALHHPRERIGIVEPDAGDFLRMRDGCAQLCGPQRVSRPLDPSFPASAHATTTPNALRYLLLPQEFNHVLGCPAQLAHYVRCRATLTSAIRLWRPGHRRRPHSPPRRLAPLRGGILCGFISYHFMVI